jgi:hypothetical protein
LGNGGRRRGLVLAEPGVVAPGHRGVAFLLIALPNNLKLGPFSLVEEQFGKWHGT